MTQSYDAKIPLREPELTIFFDGLCPLCVKEMDHLKRFDNQGKIKLIDVNIDNFQKTHPDIDPIAAMTILHAKLSSGEILLGLDVTHKAWSIVGKGIWTAPLRWPIIKWFADLGYRFFAQHRYTISKWLTGKARLDECDRCVIPPKDR